MFGGFSRHFSACKYFKERILLFAVGINIDVGAAQYFNLDIVATQQEGAIFLREEGKGTAIYCDGGNYF